MFNNPPILSNEKVTLRLINLEDVNGLFEVSKEASIFDYFPVIFLKKEDLRNWVLEKLELFDKEQWVQFVIIENKTNKIIGSTSFLGISLFNRRIEIGGTWIGKEFQGKGFNKPSKYLLLKYCFEEMGLERVELKTDVLNLQSQRAIEKIGAKKEGVFRSHMTMPNNRRRDTVYYSIVQNEWNDIKNKIFKDITDEI